MHSIVSSFNLTTLPYVSLFFSLVWVSCIIGCVSEHCWYKKIVLHFFSLGASSPSTCAWGQPRLISLRINYTFEHFLFCLVSSTMLPTIFTLDFFRETRFFQDLKTRCVKMSQLFLVTGQHNLTSCWKGKCGNVICSKNFNELYHCQVTSGFSIRQDGDKKRYWWRNLYAYYAIAWQ